jgi:two-component sensor histidine kinase
MLAEMQRQSQRMTQLVEDLLTLSRLEAQDTLPEEHVAMAPMLATLRREAEALSQGRHRISVDDDAPHRPVGLDQGTAQRLLQPGRNAVRYTPAGGEIHVRFGRDPDGGATLSVRDTGYGIPAAHLPRLTERFYRVSTSRSRESGGTGLGLAIVKHVLNLHDARLDIEAKSASGSTFACRFSPARVPRATPFRFPRPRHDPTSPSPAPRELSLRDPALYPTANCRNWTSISACWRRPRIRRCRCWSGCASCASVLHQPGRVLRDPRRAGAPRRSSACRPPPTGWRRARLINRIHDRAAAGGGAVPLLERGCARRWRCRHAPAAARTLDARNRPAGCATISATRSCRCCRRWASIPRIRSRRSSTSR